MYTVLFIFISADLVRASHCVALISKVFSSYRSATLVISVVIMFIVHSA